MKYKTSITQIKDGKEIIYGHDLGELVKEKSFVDVIYLLLRGDLPDGKQRRMMDVLLISK